MATIRMKRGIQSDIEAMPLLSGEMAVALDTGRVYVGTEEGTVPMMGDGGDMDTSVYDPQKKKQDIFAYIQKRCTRATRLVIGTTRAGWTEDDCDYLCDGTNDHVKINEAIQALPETGGEIHILDGTYDIVSSILVEKECVTISGNGAATILLRKWNGSDSTDGVIKVSASHCTLSHFTIDGNRPDMNQSRGGCIYISGESITDSIIEKMRCRNSNGRFIGVKSVNQCSIMNNIITNESYNVIYGIEVELSSGCTIFGNVISSKDGMGIRLSESNSSNIVGNVCKCGSEAYGIRLEKCENCTVVGNTSIDNKIGVFGYQSKQCVVVGNVLLRTDGEYSINGRETISIIGNSSYPSSDFIIVGNNCKGKAPTVAGNGHIVDNNLT